MPVVVGNGHGRCDTARALEEVVQITRTGIPGVPGCWKQSRCPKASGAGALMETIVSPKDHRAGAAMASPFSGGR